MKALAAIALAMLAAIAWAWERRTEGPADTGRIRIVAAAVTPPAAAPAVRVRSPGPPAAASAPVTSANADAGPYRTDADALAALLAGQTRDPAWAPGAEAAISARLRGAAVACAAFLCRIALPAPAGATDARADDLARAASRDLPDGISYNDATAAILGGPGAARLTFYATRAMTTD